MRSPHRSVIVGICAAFVFTISNRDAVAELLVQEIQNTTRTITANDLTLTFTKALKGNPTLSIVPGANFPATRTPGTNTYTWNFGKMPLVIPKGLARISFDDNNTGARIDPSDAKSFWTTGPRGGTHIVDALGLTTQKTSLDFKNGNAFVSLTNVENYNVVYTNLSLYKDNLISQFQLGQFDTPTGTLVGGIPSTFTLDPGQTTTLAFGSVNPNGYEFFSAEVANASDPSNTFYIAGGATVAEPSSSILLGIGLVASALGEPFRRARRIASHSKTPIERPE